MLKCCFQQEITFEYKVNDATCPRTIRITMTVNTCGLVLDCGTIVVHNASPVMELMKIRNR
jgi:hypothetical protein